MKIKLKRNFSKKKRRKEIYFIFVHLGIVVAVVAGAVIDFKGSP